MFTHKRTRASMAAAVTALAAAATLIAVTGAGAQAAATAESGWSVHGYATGFPVAGGIGPIGVAAQGDEMWIGSYNDGHLYRFGPGGGTTSAATRVSGAPIEARLAGRRSPRTGGCTRPCSAAAGWSSWRGVTATSCGSSPAASRTPRGSPPIR